MARAIKILLGIIAFLLVLIILTIIALPHIIDFNEHKEEIQAGIKQTTGYEVQIEGDIELSFIPWLGINLGETTVANPPDFEPKHLASVQELQARLKVWPLLLGRVEMDKIVLNGLNLDLIKDEEGRTNWQPQEIEQDLQEEAALIRTAEANQGQDQTNRLFIPALDIAGLEVSNSHVSYRDLGLGQKFQISDLNLKSERITQDEPFQLEASMAMDSSEPNLSCIFKLDARALVSGEQPAIELRDTVLEMDVQGDPLPEPIREGKFQGDMAYDLQAQSLNISRMDLHAWDANLKGEIQALDLDARPRIVFDLEGDNLDLDIFLAQNNAPDAGHPKPNPENSDNGDIDLAFLHDYQVEGKIKLNDTTLHNARIDVLETELTSGNGELILDPVQAELYQGTLQGWINVRDVRDEAHVEMEHALKDVQVGPLLEDTTDMGFLEGKARMDADLNTFGTHADAFVKNLFGDAQISVQEGSIRGMDLAQTIREVFAAIHRDEAPDVDPEGETEFSSLQGSFSVGSGVAVSEDLTLESPVLGAAGEMTLDLPQSRVDSRVNVFLEGALKEEMTSRYDLPDVGIPLRIQGPFEDVQVRVDVESIVQRMLQEEGERFMQEMLDQLIPSPRDPENLEDAPENGAREFMQQFMR